MNQRTTLFAFGLAAIAAHGLACTGDNDSASSAIVPGANAELLRAPPAGRGLQYAMTTEIGPGSEVEHCQFVRAPDTGMVVNHDEVRFTRGSHHVLLYETAYDEIPTMREDGTPVDSSGVFDCSEGPTNGFRVTKLIAGSQNGHGQSMLAFPEGIGVRVTPGRVLMINAHYINTTAETIHPELRINLYTVPEQELKTEGDLLFFYNPFIEARAGMRSRAQMRCPVVQDVTVTNVQSHMHARGVGYAAAVDSDTPFYVNDRWEDVPVQTFDPGLTLRAGQHLDYHCDYQNNADNDVYQGLRTRDEMCMLIGSYYPAVPGFGTCDNADGSTAAEWVGQGTSSCAASLGCAMQAFGDQEHGMQSLTGCIMRSRPEVSAQLSAVLRCQFGAMPGGQPPDCSAAIAACQSR